MCDIEDPPPHPSVPFTFKFGTTPQEMNDCFDNVGRILTVILESKLNPNFYNILYRLKPIADIDEYMLKFNFDRDVALIQNQDLSYITKFWLQDSTELRAESESALESIVKVEDFIKLLEKQELNYKSFVTRALEFVTNQESLQRIESQRSDTSLPVVTHTKQTHKNGLAKTMSKEILVPEVISEVKLIIKVRGESLSYTLAKAIEEIQKTKDLYEKHFFATKCLRHCIEVLMAINEFNRMSIARWKLGENAIKMRSNLWTNRKQEHKQIDNKPKK